ncbi:TetR/AcrR family transcriptional regulator [Microbacterium sp. GXF7504]
MTEPTAVSPRRRADAVRNAEAVLEAAKAAFAETGVDTPMRDIAARAGVGVGTIYRSYPQRSDLIIAVFRLEVDATALAAEELGAQHPPAEALRLWAEGFARFVSTKRGLKDALHSGDPAYQSLPAYFLGTLAPRVQRILDDGAVAGTIRADVTAEDLILALSRLAGEGPDGGRMTGVLVDGLLRG